MTKQITAVPIEDEKVKEWVKHMFTVEDDDVRLIQPYNQVLLKEYMNIHEEIQNFETKDDDVFICTAPKSGMISKSRKESPVVKQALPEKNLYWGC